MTFKKLSANVLEPASQWLMVLGIVALCQPWSMIAAPLRGDDHPVGLVGFSIFSKIKPGAGKRSSTQPMAEIVLRDVEKYFG